MKYLITGASGFVGRHLCRYLDAKNIDYIGCVRTASSDHHFQTDDLATFDNWSELFKNIDLVIHTAGKAHDMSKSEAVNKAYTDLNLNLTVKIASQAKVHHVKRFIFISSIKVNGEQTSEIPFSADGTPVPGDEYAISKYLAEKELLKLHEPGIFEVVIIRPCLIYGPGVKANFRSLIKLVGLGLPLPFGNVNNKRSFVSIDNLLDLIYTCAQHPQASGQIFLVSDDCDLSLTELIQKIAESMGKKNILIPVPALFLKILFTLIGKKDVGTRLLSNLQADILKTKQLLNWKPPVTIEQTLKKMISDK